MSDQGQVPEPEATVSPVDVLAQCCIAMQYTASAMLSAITLCRQSGLLDARQSVEIVDKASSEIDEIVKKVNSQSNKRSVFMRATPAGVQEPPSPK